MQWKFKYLERTVYVISLKSMSFHYFDINEIFNSLIILFQFFIIMNIEYFDYTEKLNTLTK